METSHPVKPRIKLKVTPELPGPDKKQAMRNQIKGAIKGCIHDHGPVTKSLIGSVLKRLEHQPEYRRLLNESEEEG